jgi:hypothetical protein
MIRTKVLTAILTGVSLITAAASARDDDFACPVVAPAKVNVNFARSAEHVETDVSLQQVREAAEGHHPGPVLGFYVGTLRYGIEIDDTIRQPARGRFCATPKYVSLTVHHDRAIHIPREFVGDPCLAALARDHEAKHAEADAIAVDHSRSSLVSAIRHAVRANTIVASASRLDALAILTTGIQTGVDRVFDDMVTERRRLDAAVDSTSDLERLKTGCEGRASQWAPGNALRRKEETAHPKRGGED